MHYAVEDAPSLDLQFLKKHGYFAGSRSGVLTWTWMGEKTGSISLWSFPHDGYIRFQYTSKDRFTGESTARDYRVRFLTTHCYLGGVRRWFECPKCFKRAGTLFFNEIVARCRKCVRLYYRSQFYDRTSYSRLIGRVLNAEDLEEQIWNLRTKTYRGRPTRRYTKLLDRCQRYLYA